MKLEDQVCSLELAKRLKEFGVKQESAFYWTNVHWEKGREPRWALISSELINGERWRTPKNGFSAFTVAELGEMLTKEQIKNSLDGSDDTEANARAKMLIHLSEKGIVKV